MSSDGSNEGAGSGCWADRNSLCVVAVKSMSVFLLTMVPALRQALQRLGYLNTYHMMRASVENPPDCLMWHDALIAKYDGIGQFGRKEWDQLLGDCQVRGCCWQVVLIKQGEVTDCTIFRQLVTGRPVLLQRNLLKHIQTPRSY
jgi:sulfotransferase family protein